MVKIGVHKTLNEGGKKGESKKLIDRKAKVINNKEINVLIRK